MDGEPLDWIARYGHLVQTGGTVLDVACGGGRHARWFASQGHPVVAVDIDLTRFDAGEHAERIQTLAADLEDDAWPFAGQRFAGIVVTNYLHRAHFGALIDALDDEGVLLFDTFSAGHERLGRPTNPDYLLRPGELLDAFGLELTALAYVCGDVGEPPVAVRQSLAAVRERRG